MEQTQFTLPKDFYRVDNWIYDKDNNRVLVCSWRDEEDCYKQLLTLNNCSGCSNCFNCSNCSDCSDCFGCSDCLGCLSCIDCLNCSNCLECSNCLKCSHCADCLDCSDCLGLLRGRRILEIPKVNNLFQKIYKAINESPKAFDMGTWHGKNLFGVTHCMAGWIVHIAGESGYALEKTTTTAFAAIMIAKESGQPISPVRFYDKQDVALENIKRLTNTGNK